MAAVLSFTPGLCPALGDQLGDEVTVFWDVARYDGLRRFDRLLRGAQSQLTLPDRLDQQLIARLDTGGGAAFRGITIRPCWLILARAATAHLSGCDNFNER
jgi:hypothetical protein